MLRKGSRRWSVMWTALVVALAFAVWLTPASAATQTPQGLWDYTAVPNATFDDGGSVELGVKFQTSEPVYVVGVRFYRVDSGTVSGHLWDASGSLLRSAQFAAAPSGWQDVSFSDPQAMSPGDTFIASYFAPNADYAYAHYYFTNSGLTVGPVTALQSVDGNRNGVYYYDAASAFPTDSYRDSNYWVTPLWTPKYTLSGFYHPVDMGGVYNTVKGGATVPLKFEVFWGDTEQTDISVVDRFEVTPIACPNATAMTDGIEFTATGGTTLRYDGTAGQFIQNWQTPKKSGTCYKVTMFTTDGSSISANFKLR